MGESVTQNGTEVKLSFPSRPRWRTKNLIALHNLTEEKLWGDLRLGGFPCPPSLLPGLTCPTPISETLRWSWTSGHRPQSKPQEHRLLSADAWTPTFPQVEYAADPAAERRISGRLRELSGKVDEMFKARPVSHHL